MATGPALSIYPELAPVIALTMGAVVTSFYPEKMDAHLSAYLEHVTAAATVAIYALVAECAAWCIIAKLAVTANLLEANARLSCLPHMFTFPDYSPHVTLAYIAGDEAERDRAIAALNAELAGVQLPVSSELNYGKR